jgi:hypothetical protein
MTLASRASPQERKTEAFFDNWMRATMFLTLEETGAYAALASWIVRTGKLVDEASARYVTRVSARKWRSLKAGLLKEGAIREVDGGISIPALEGRLYRTGYLYRKAVIPSKLRWAVFQRDGYQCVTCSTHEDLTADHIIPEIEGGETSLGNLQTLCRPCNSRKWAHL